MPHTEAHPDWREDEFDKTSLTSTGAGKTVHRDYAAHYFRWGWAVERAAPLGLGRRRVLDVGCGVELPLFRSLMRYTNQHPEFYVGVDLNKLKPLTEKQQQRAALYGGVNFLEIAQGILDTHGQFDAIVCFEVIEHMTPQHGWELLWWFRQMVKPDGHVLLSTPAYDGQRHAHNHIHEYTKEELESYITAAGFDVAKRFGTFCNVKDVKPAMQKWSANHGYDAQMFETLWDELAEFHSNEVLSTFVAPLIPDVARNIAWKLTPR
jgi:2-polyprenyl-3-methyl-5-hydroxy-6-metoxy-1,4-benzoquinol methylase